ncbi:MAG: AbrB/MazE/SpoVT family DNA-binding domain-containing protein [Gemmatimonadetes bacterium]|nr:AbrB/MazE/SpoVT family DNA-binding domain-containing protein [Gemmatimonadota bacterium]
MKSKARIVRVGNSRGIRIPKAMLDEAGLADDVELDARAGSITIRSARQPRAGWAEAAAQLAARGNGLLDPAAPTEFDDTEWVWE